MNWLLSACSMRRVCWYLNNRPKADNLPNVKYFLGRGLTLLKGKRGTLPFLSERGLTKTIHITRFVSNEVRDAMLKCKRLKAPGTGINEM